MEEVQSWKPGKKVLLVVSSRERQARLTAILSAIGVDSQEKPDSLDFHLRRRDAIRSSNGSVGRAQTECVLRGEIRCAGTARIHCH
jgi:hypothetical protein